MRVAIVVEGWPGQPALDARSAAIEVAEAWRAKAPADEVAVLAVGDGGPRSADVWEGERVDVAPGVVAVRRGESLWLAPGSAVAWDAVALVAALARLADAGERWIVVPLGDVLPAGDDISGGWWDAALRAAGPDLPHARQAFAGTEIIALVGADRPLLGFRGMNAARADASPGDAALAAASHDAESAWAARAALVDAVAPRRGLLGATRLADAPGAGAAGGLAFALAAVGAAIRPGAQTIADEAGLAEASASADLVLAVTGELTPRALDHGPVVPASAAAAARGVPAVVLSAAVHVGKRDLMAAGVAGAHEAAAGPAGLAEGIRRVAQTWSRS